MFYLSDIFRLFWICSIFNENIKLSESLLYSSIYWQTKPNYDFYYDYWRPSQQQKLLYPLHYDDLPTSYNSYLSSTLSSSPLLSPSSSDTPFSSPPLPSSPSSPPSSAVSSSASSSSSSSPPLSSLSSSSPSSSLSSASISAEHQPSLSSSKSPSSSSSIPYILNDPLKANLIYHQSSSPSSSPPPPPSSSVSSLSPIDLVSLFKNKGKKTKKNGFWKLWKKRKPIKKDTYLYEDNSEHYHHHHHHHHYFHHYIKHPKTGKIRGLWNRFVKKRPSKEKIKQNLNEYELITNSCKHGPILYSSLHSIENRLQNQSNNYQLPYIDDEYLNLLPYNDKTKKA